MNVEFVGMMDISILYDDRSTIGNVKQDKINEAQLKSTKITKPRTKRYTILIFILFCSTFSHFSNTILD